MSWFGGLFGNHGASDSELPEIYPLALKCSVFIDSDILATYVKILTDTAERMHGLSDEKWPLLWDSCVQSQSSKGLVTLLAEAMLAQAELFLVYKPSVQVLRLADDAERRVIEQDYKREGKSKVGVFVSFKGYRKTDMLRVFSEMEFCALSSLHKTMNLAKAVQLKMSEMRSSVSLTDASVTIDQAKSIAEALRRGLDIMVDAKDEITTSTPDIGPTKAAIEFLDAKRAFHLSLPLAYISGLQTGGIGSTGDADARAIDRGLKQYFVSVLQPVVEAVFEEDVVYQPEDGRQISEGLDVLKAFELVSDTYLSATTKRAIAARVFDVDPTKEQELLDAEAKTRGSVTTLNGAQAGALAVFLEQLAAGGLAPETAIKTLQVTFAMPQKDAEGIVLPMRKFLAAKQAAAPAQLPPANGGNF